MTRPSSSPAKIQPEQVFECQSPPKNSGALENTGDEKEEKRNNTELLELPPTKEPPKQVFPHAGANDDASMPPVNSSGNVEDKEVNGQAKSPTSKELLK